MKISRSKLLLSRIAVGCLFFLLSGCEPKAASFEITNQTASWDGVKRGDVRYEIFVRSFADTNGDGVGDLKGVTRHLPMLDEWGINALWLMPINPSPSYHGYDVEDYYGINPSYGTMEDFEEMVSVAKSNDIEIIIDMVLNHCSKTHPMFIEACEGINARYRDYFIFVHKDSIARNIRDGKVPSVTSYDQNKWHTPDQGDQNYRYFGDFSSWMPDFNPENPAVMDMFVEIADFWIKKGVDGFRLDAIKHIYSDETSKGNITFWDEYHRRLKALKSDIYLVGEVLSEYTIVAPFLASIPACFNFNSWWQLHWALNNATGRYYPNDMQKVMDAFKAVNPRYVHVTKLSNHDEDRTMSVLGSDIEKVKLAMTIINTMPGQPYFYYGEEIGMKGIKTGGDEHVREPYLWSNSATDQYRTSWIDPVYNSDATVVPLDKQLEDDNSIATRFLETIKIRNTYPALAQGALTFPDPGIIPASLMVYSRIYGDSRMLVIHNLGDMEQEYSAVIKPLNIAVSWGEVSVDYQDSVMTVTMAKKSTIIIEY